MVRLSCQGQALYKHWISVHHGELECIQRPYAIQTLDYHVSEWDVQSFSGIYISNIASIVNGVAPQVVIYMPNQCCATRFLPANHRYTLGTIVQHRQTHDDRSDTYEAGTIHQVVLIIGQGPINGQ
jgi:hypothetical protein